MSRLLKHIYISLYLQLLSFSLIKSQHGYHYLSFSGPVSGEIRQVIVPGANHYHPLEGTPHQHANNHLHNVDYVAKPDYQYAYGVLDPVTGNNQQHEQSRDGDVVRGKYTVIEPDGSLRTVTYTADPKNGFQATVHNSGPNPAEAPTPSPPQQKPYQNIFDHYHDPYRSDDQH